MSHKPRTSHATRKRIRIMLVDDHPMVRERLADVINREADLIVSGEAEDRHEAIASHPRQAARPGDR